MATKFRNHVEHSGICFRSPVHPSLIIVLIVLILANYLVRCTEVSTLKRGLHVYLRVLVRPLCRLITDRTSPTVDSEWLSSLQAVLRVSRFQI